MPLVLWVVLGGWLVLGVLGALVIGRSIRLADRQELDLAPSVHTGQPVRTPRSADPCPLRRRRARGAPPAVSRCVGATHRTPSNREP
ncbi:hypothetical protein ACI79D_20200 [Geodermatophilus sp. SYSU D00708]